MLRTCRQIYEETSDLIYERGTFIFGIRPPIPNYDFDGGSYSAAVRSTCIRRWRFHFPDDDPVFRYIPYERIGEIIIEIEAPDQTDPGQIMAHWRKVKRLVDLLSKAGSLMKLEIHFTDSRKGRWFADGNPQQSMTASPFIETGNAEPPNDFRIILLLFTNLRNVKNVRFHVPQDESTPNSFIKKCTKAMMAGDLFWSGLVNSALPEDQEFQDELDTTFMQFDRAIDTLLLSDAARWLRLERFSEWYVKDPSSGEVQESEYVKDLQRISTAGRIPVSAHGNTPEAIQERYIYMHCFNPLGQGV